MNIASTVKFSELCQVFEETCASKSVEKSNALSSFIRIYKEKGGKLKLNNKNAVTSFYPAIRLILPQLERERGPYGLKEFTLAKRIVKMLCLPPQGRDAIRLTNFRSDDSSNVKDFAESAYWVLRKHFIDSSEISILEVNQYLDRIASLHAENNPRGVDQQLMELFKQTKAEEQKWLIRIILKDLKLGMGQDRILKLYHPDAADFYTVNNCLSVLCDKLSELSIRLHEIEISLFSPFRPMLSNRCDVSQFHKTFMKAKTVFVETKFDGERFQLHMKNNKFKYFSRNGFDFTQSYGEDFSSGLYTPLLVNVFNTKVKSIILDGEMMGWNKKTNRFGSKAMEFDVKHLKPHNVYQPCFCVFDILLLNDEILTNTPLRGRQSLLYTIITQLKGTFHISEPVETTNEQGIIDALNLSMDREEEGIVFKDPESLYKHNDRNAGWWKMKLEYFENVMSDLDVIVLGGYYGDGKHSGKISGFLVGVSVTKPDDKFPVEYYSFAKIASGLSDEELKTVHENLGPHWIKTKDGNPQDHGVYFGKEKPHVWIPPCNSLVFLVRGSELIRSSDFKTDYTLRFPRIQKIRLDKLYHECLTLTELLELTGSSKPVQKLSKRHLEISDLEVVEKERKVRRRYANVEMIPVEEKADFLAGYEFCVLTGCEEWKKEDVEICIRENGGTVVLNEGPSTFCIVVGDFHPRVNTCKQFGSLCDMVKLKWLKKVLDTKVFKLFSPMDCICATKETKNRFLNEFDKYGDSYLEDTKPDTIEDVVEAASVDYVHPTDDEIEDLDQDMQCSNFLRCFNGSIAYFDSTVNGAFSVEQEVFKFLGGTVSANLNEGINLVVTDDRSRFDELYRELKLNSDPLIVAADYIRIKFDEILQNNGILIDLRPPD
ncbi:hypothetical protein FQR65_LT04189 [Abscondita terminalis]|nr:hypothetical protein FQR65_LT04189 [Abscondita terminalis]